MLIIHWRALSSHSSAPSPKKETSSKRKANASRLSIWMVVESTKCWFNHLSRSRLSSHNKKVSPVSDYRHRRDFMLFLILLKMIEDTLHFIGQRILPTVRVRRVLTLVLIHLAGDFLRFGCDLVDNMIILTILLIIRHLSYSSSIQIYRYCNRITKKINFKGHKNLISHIPIVLSCVLSAPRE